MVCVRRKLVFLGSENSAFEFFACDAVAKCVSTLLTISESLSETFSLSSSNSLNLTLFAKNLLDEVARNHTSFVKDQVPLPGRNFGLKINLEL